MAVATEARDRALMMGAGGVALAGVIFWLLGAADIRAKKAERARRRFPGEDLPSP